MILAFNTSLADLHIGSFSDTAEPLAEYHHLATGDERHVHDALLARSVSDLLDTIPASAKDISRIAFINGPGSFTGLRIGLAFAKGMAFGSEHISLVPLIAHSVLLEQYKKGNTIEGNLPILYPGYAKDTVYVSYSDDPEKVAYMTIGDLVKTGITDSICSAELAGIGIPHHIVSIDLRTMAEMSIGYQPSASLADLEPFYGTDFKPGITG